MKALSGDRLLLAAVSLVLSQRSRGRRPLLSRSDAAEAFEASLVPSIKDGGRVPRGSPRAALRVRGAVACPQGGGPSAWTGAALPLSGMFTWCFGGGGVLAGWRLGPCLLEAVALTAPALRPRRALAAGLQGTQPSFA